jgi:hypothetical protein
LLPKPENSCILIPGKFWCQDKKCNKIAGQAIFDKEDQEISWFCSNCGLTSQVSLKKKGYGDGKKEYQKNKEGK